MQRDLQIKRKHAVLIMWLVLVGCSDPTLLEQHRPVELDRLQIVAVNAPLTEFTRRLAGDLAEVSMLVPQDEDPALWEPSAEDVITMQRSDLVVLNGAGYEPWLDRVALPASLLLDTSATLAEDLIETATVVHQHGPEGAHSHGAMAFTIWLDPLLAIEQALAVSSALAVLRPEQTAAIETRFGLLERDLRELHDGWQVLSMEVGETPILFSHPVYQYFASRYSLNGRSLHWEPLQDPGEEAWSALDDLLAEHPAEFMIWEAEPLATTVDRLQSMGVQALVVDPASTSTHATDYLHQQRENVARVRVVLARDGS